MAEEFDIPFTIYETPAHVYASITHRNKEIIVELTAPREGFDFGSNMDALLQTLVNSKLISRDELAEKGPKELYREYVAKTIPISKKQLLGIQYHNDALIKAEINEYEDAYDQMNKAVMLYPNEIFSEAFKYLITISQLDFTLDNSKKYNLLNKLLISTKNDSVLSYTLMNHLGELIEDLLKLEENFELTANLLSNVDANIFHNQFIDGKMKEYNVYMYTVFAQNASLKGESLDAKNYIEKALNLDPNNSRLTTYYVSVTSNYASKLSQLGLFEQARAIIDKLSTNYPSGYPVIQEAQVRIILDALVPLEFSIENESKLLPELELARSIQPDNIYLKSFAATIFHELAMQQVRRANYQKAKELILNGLDYTPSDAILRSDLDLIIEMLK
jgi:predicted Zn-dependent protease